MLYVIKGRRASAFSLVELSIVLVILGLLVGGILAGQSLIRAASLRGVTTEFQRYVTASNAFRDKYFYLPGDMPNATGIWGVLATDGFDATCQTTTATGTATCNGDGNGNMTLYYPGSSTPIVYERWRHWQHLANAGLIEGQYAGRAATPRVPGVHVPVSKLPDGFFMVQGGEAAFAGSTSDFPRITGALTYVYTSNNATTANGAPFTPEEAWNIDTKLDDGLPNDGKIVSFKGDGTTMFCSTLAGQAGHTGGAYNLSLRSKDCGLYFMRVY